VFSTIEDPDHGFTFRTVSAPFRIAGADIAVRGPAPDLGRHGREVLAEAGFGPDEIEALDRAGVIRPAEGA
jgi:crotonobetainyl-CoA:carnitine CoA-transferase CaiB-like acyl-CoA transferase